MMIDDLRKTFEAAARARSTPAKAQQLAKDMMDPGAAKEQVAKTAADLLEWSQSNRERMTTFVRRRDLRSDEERSGARHAVPSSMR